jgi:hypothetical protein
MVPHHSHVDLRRLAALPAVLTTIAALSLASACDKVPLLAPSGTVITLFPAATSVPVNGQVEIVATVIENGVAATPPAGGTNGTGGTTTTNQPGAGTPVQNGTLVSFTTTLGRIEPSEARTTNGQVRVKFIASGQSGQATITAFSGGASGKLENLLVGSAAAERVLVSATPQTLGPAGGQAQISARVEDISGAGLVGVPVTFSTTAGQLSAASVVTDNTGTALTVLTTSRESTVTANVAGKTAEITIGLNPRTGVTLTGPTTPVSAGLPANFTVGVGATANIRDVTVDFGDGARQSLGALSGSTTVPHTFTTPGTFTVTAVATEASGFTEQVSTSITILPGQPPGVTITPSNNRPTVGETVILTANVTGATSTILRYEWTFGGTGADRPSAVTTGNQVPVTYSQPGTKVITVNVVQAAGPSGNGSTSVVVLAGGG